MYRHFVFWCHGTVVRAGITDLPCCQGRLGGHAHLFVSPDLQYSKAYGGEHGDDCGLAPHSYISDMRT